MADESWEHEEMVEAPAADSVVRVIFKTVDGVLLCYGTAANTVLEADTDTFAPGCIYIKSLTAGSSILYNNVGTRAAPNFDVMTIT